MRKWESILSIKSWYRGVCQAYWSLGPYLMPITILAISLLSTRWSCILRCWQAIGKYYKKSFSWTFCKLTKMSKLGSIKHSPNRYSRKQIFLRLRLIRLLTNSIFIVICSKGYTWALRISFFGLMCYKHTLINSSGSCLNLTMNWVNSSISTRYPLILTNKPLNER